MSGFLKITKFGKYMLVNLDSILNIVEEEEGKCCLYISNGNQLYPDDTFAQVCEALDDLLR